MNTLHQNVFEELALQAKPTNGRDLSISDYQIEQGISYLVQANASQTIPINDNICQLVGPRSRVLIWIVWLSGEILETFLNTLISKKKSTDDIN